MIIIDPPAPDIFASFAFFADPYFTPDPFAFLADSNINR
jgi:hypothetical protein